MYVFILHHELKYLDYSQIHFNIILILIYHIFVNVIFVFMLFYFINPLIQELVIQIIYQNLFL